MGILAIIIGTIMGLCVLGLLFKPFFGDVNGFIDCVKFWFTPDIFSFFNGEGYEDLFAELKLGIWFFLGIVSGIGSYMGILKFLAPN